MQDAPVTKPPHDATTGDYGGMDLKSMSRAMCAVVSELLLLVHRANDKGYLGCSCELWCCLRCCLYTRAVALSLHGTDRVVTKA